jgi:hypothetical protein
MRRSGRAHKTKCPRESACPLYLSEAAASERRTILQRYGTFGPTRSQPLPGGLCTLISSRLRRIKIYFLLPECFSFHFFMYDLYVVLLVII